MPDVAVHTALRAVALEAAPVADGTDGRTISVRLVRYGITARVTDDVGRSFYDETFAANSVRVETDAPVYNELPRTGDPHRDRPQLVGRIVSYRSAVDGCYADVRIANSSAGRDLLAEIDEKVKRHVSIEFDAPTLPPAGRSSGPVVHTDATVKGLLFTNRPQSPGADILGRRSQGEPEPMSDTPTPTPTDPIPTPAPAPAPPVAPAPIVNPETPTGLRSVPGLDNLPGAAPAAPAQETRFRSFGEFAHAAAFGTARVSLEEREAVYRALQVASTADATGMIQTQWIAQIADLVKKYTPTVDAFDKGPLPAKGLTVSIPKVTQRPTVAKQVNEGDVISSQKVIIAPVNYTVNAYGGGQSMSVTVMQRTEPAYLNEVMKLYAIEMGRALETAVTAAVVTASTVTNAAIEMGNTDALIDDAFTAACLPFLNNLDRLPEFALINTVMWQRLAGAVDTTGRPLYPSVSPFNPWGAISFRNPDGQVRDLPFRVAPRIGGATAVAIVAVPEAFVTMIDTPQTMQADVPETLSHQFAVYEFAAFGAIDNAGLVKIVDLV